MTDIKDIAKHVAVLNEELGLVKNDINWIKKIMYYVAGALTIGLGKIIIYP